MTLWRALPELVMAGLILQTMLDEMPRIFTKERMQASRSAIKKEHFIPIKIGDSDYLQGMNMEESPSSLDYIIPIPKLLLKFSY